MAGRIPKVVVVGPAYVDMAVRCAGFPGPGETVEGAGFSCIPTGEGVNRSIAAAFCGCEVYFVGKVGDDAFGSMIKDNLVAHRVNTDYVCTAKAMSTGIIVTMVNSEGENGSCISTGANRALTSDEVGCASVEQLIGSADVCLIHGDLPEDTVSTVIRMCEPYSTKVVLETKLSWPLSGAAGDVDLPNDYCSADVLVPDFRGSPLEAEIAAGANHQVKFIGSELVARGVGSVVIKMGPRGSFITQREGTTQINGFDVGLVDQTGCGDAFAGALAASCGAGDSVEDAARFAGAAGALARTKFGSQDALPTKEEIIELLQKDDED